MIFEYKQTKNIATKVFDVLKILFSNAKLCHNSDPILETATPRHRQLHQQLYFLQVVAPEIVF